MAKAVKNACPNSTKPHQGTRSEKLKVEQLGASLC